LIDDLLRQTRERRQDAGEVTPDLFADFNGIPEGADKTEFYQHDQNWSNRMILGDSLQVMASLAEREGLRGKVQCIYFDPPYGIKFNSNFQWSTTSRDVKDGNAAHITREPEQVKAFRDTWRDGIHSYLTYLRDRLTVARDLLAESGSIFVQIGDENVHRIQALMDEVFGDRNIVASIVFSKTASQTSRYIPAITDFVLWYAKDVDRLKYRQLFELKGLGTDIAERYDRGLRLDGTTFLLDQQMRLGVAPLPADTRVYSLGDLTSQRQGRSTGPESAMGFPVHFKGATYQPTGTRGWSTTRAGIERLARADRVEPLDRNLRYRRVLADFPATPRSNVWTDITGVQSRSDPKVSVVQTATTAIQRCVLMATDPGDLVLDPTCGSGTTAMVAEQWGRRWVTIDTSRVALALARARIMGARYLYYTLADSRDGQLKEAEITRTAPSSQLARGDIRQGFVYERVPHITLRTIANDAEIDVIWEKWQLTLGPLCEAGRMRVKVNGVDVFDPSTGEVRSDGPDGIACWFVDTDYNEESFFVRQAYFLGANDPYGALKTTLKAEIDEAAWATLHSDVSRPFEKPKSGRIAVKVINHLGDEVMKVFRVG
ncbi:MAG: site-specific DNA-methyltransferase, partial [Gemmatimonadota bacterium]